MVHHTQLSMNCHNFVSQDAEHSAYILMTKYLTRNVMWAWNYCLTHMGKPRMNMALHRKIQINKNCAIKTALSKMTYSNTLSILAKMMWHTNIPTILNFQSSQLCKWNNYKWKVTMHSYTYKYNNNKNIQPPKEGQGKRWCSHRLER